MTATKTETHVLCDFSAGEKSTNEALGFYTQKCKGFVFQAAAKPCMEIQPLRFNDTQTDFSSSLNIKRLFAFDKFILGISSTFRLFYSSVFAPGFISQEAVFSEIPEMRIINYNGKPTALLFTSKATDSSVIWSSPNEPIIVLPSLSVKNILQTGSRLYGSETDSSQIEYIDSYDITEWNTEEKTVCIAGKAERIARIEEALSKIYAFGSSSVMKLTGNELITIAEIDGIAINSICKLNGEIYFAAKDGLYRIDYDSAERIIAMSFDSKAQASAFGNYLVLCDENVFVYDISNKKLSSLGSLSVNSVVHSTEADRFIFLTQSGDYKQLCFSAESNNYNAEYTFSTDILKPHIRKRLNYLSLVGKGDYLLTVTGSEGSSLSQGFTLDGKKPYILPVSLVSSRFTINLKAKLSPSSYLQGLVGNFTSLTEALL